MAIDLKNKQNVDAPSGAFPYGNIRDDDGSGNGTPVDVQVYADFHQFFAHLLDTAGVSPNNLPDNLYNTFQYWNALFTNLLGGVKKLVVPIGDWNMNTTASVTVGLDSITSSIPSFLNKVTRISVLIKNDLGGSLTQEYDLFNLERDGTFDAAFRIISPNRTIILSRNGSGFFQTTRFQNTGYNRGFITFEYTP